MGNRFNPFAVIQILPIVSVLLLWVIPSLYAQEGDLVVEDDQESFSWDEVEEKAPWSQWVERLIGFADEEEGLEELTPLLLRLERWYNYPRDLNTLTAEDLDYFFWLSAKEKKKFLDFREEHLFTSPEELYAEDILLAENYGLTLPFIKVGKNAPRPDQATEIHYGSALRAKELTEMGDFWELLKNYQIKVFGNIQQPGVFDFHYLAERDPNELRVFDLNKWSLAVSFLPDEVNRLTLTGGALSVKIHQSLLMATGYPLRKNEKAPWSVKKNGSRIQADKSTQEIFFEGWASDFVYGTWRLATWAGQFRYDDILLTNDTDPSELYADGYSFYPSTHRPFPEHTLRENLFGLLLEKFFDYHVLSVAVLYSRFAYPVITTDPDEFYGQSHAGVSVGWDLDFNRYRWYGEAVFLVNEKRGDPGFRGSGAVTTGGRVFFPESDLFLSLRFIPQSYQAVHNLAYTRYSGGNDEFGILAGYRLRPLPRLTWISSADFFKQVSGEDRLRFGIDLSQLIRYRHRSGYYNESRIRLRERGEWEDDYNHFWDLQHQSGWRNSDWLVFAEVKLNGNLITELTEKGPHPFGLLLSLHGEYRPQDLSVTVMEILWARDGPRIFYDSLYHNRFFHDLLALSRDAFLVFLRQEFRFHPLFHTGFSLGFYWDSAEGELFHSAPPDRVMFSFYISGEVGG